MTGEQRTYLRHKISEHRRAQLARAQQPRCAGCGGTRDRYTEGCEACTDRRRYRKYRQGHRYTTPCRGCGHPIAHDNLRRRKVHAGVELCYGCLRAACAGCGKPVDQFTRGCPACRFRHHKRKLTVRRAEGGLV